MNLAKDRINKRNYNFLLRGLLILVLFSCLFLFQVRVDVALSSQPTTEGRHLAMLKPVTNFDDLLAQLKEDAIKEMEEKIDQNIEKVVACEGCCYYYADNVYDYFLSTSSIGLSPMELPHMELPHMELSYLYYSGSMCYSAGLGGLSSGGIGTNYMPGPYSTSLSSDFTSVTPFASDIASTSLPESASDYSTTNMQVPGVDEADFIKNDGSYIYILADGNFRIIDAWPPEDANIISTVKVDGAPKKLFVANDRALIYSSLESIDGGSYSSSNDNECTYGYNCDFTGDNRKLKITIFDISDRSDPLLVREIRFDGSYINSRRVESAVHTVVFSPSLLKPELKPELKYWPEIYTKCKLTVSYYYDYPNYYGYYGSYFGGYDYPGYGMYVNSEIDRREEEPTLEELLAAFEQLKEENRKIIEDSTIEDWFPSIQDTIYGPDGTVINSIVLYDCTNFYDTEIPDSKALLRIVSMDIGSLEKLNHKAIFGYPGAVYASASALYISSRQKHESGKRWFYDESSNIQEASTVHKFRLQNEPPGAEYVGSGVVKGRVLNQFSMDEHNGYLRIATTTNYLPSPDVHSTLSVLEEKSGELIIAGQIDNIAPKEDIRSVRFFGNRGFIVTFKKTDPLFAFDLSDPNAPRIAGELKIPGYSTYMHPLDDDHLLTIGYDANDQGSFAWFQGIMLQIFDVSDMADLKLMHKKVIGTRGSTSEAAQNHLAFNYFAPKKLLAIPVTICEGGSGGSYGTDMTFSGLKVYDVSLEDGFKERGRVSHKEPCENCTSLCSNWWTSPNSVVKRSIFMDDYVYSVAMDQIIINNLNNMGVNVGVVKLQ